MDSKYPRNDSTSTHNQDETQPKDPERAFPFEVIAKPGTLPYGWLSKRRPVWNIYYPGRNHLFTAHHLKCLNRWSDVQREKLERAESDLKNGADPEKIAKRLCNLFLQAIRDVDTLTLWGYCSIPTDPGARFLVRMGSKDEPPDLVTCYLTLLKDEAGRVLLDAYYLSRLEQQWSTVPKATDDELIEMVERRDKLLTSQKEV